VEWETLVGGGALLRLLLLLAGHGGSGGRGGNAKAVEALEEDGMVGEGTGDKRRPTGVAGVECGADDDAPVRTGCDVLRRMEMGRRAVSLDKRFAEREKDRNGTL